MDNIFSKDIIELEKAFSEWKHSEVKPLAKILFECSMNKKRALKIKFQTGYVLLAMLISNPEIKIDLIDNDIDTNEHVEYLNRRFGYRINYLKNEMTNLKYDLLHIDNFSTFDLNKIKSCSLNGAKIIFDDIDAPGLKNLIINDSALKSISTPAEVYPKCFCDYIYPSLTQKISDFKLGSYTDLCYIMKKYGSDKGLGWHNYTIFYDYLFKDIRKDKLNIFEMGLGTNDTSIPSNMGVNGRPGASLRGWKEYFPNSEIYGADIDKKIIFQEERIKTYYCNQLDVECIQMMFKNIGDKKFDIIIDDGLHTIEAGLTFYTEAVKHLKDGGFYIIEDLLKEYVEGFTKTMPEMKILRLDNPKNKFDNNLALFQK